LKLSVFVLDRQGKALMPCTEKRARLLLARGRARVHRVLPFVIRLLDVRVQDCEVQPLRIKLDPGSQTTGIALVREAQAIALDTGEITSTSGTVVLHLFELVHRGRQISEALTARRQMRRRRRGQLRYRAPRFLNRGNKGKGWLAPSLRHRIDTTVAWVQRLRRWAPVSALSQELVRFDMQAMDKTDIEGVEYQQGTLAGYELRVPAGEVGPQMCVLWCRERAIADRAHSPALKRWIESREQFDVGMPVLQREEIGPAHRGVLGQEARSAQTYPGPGQAATQRRGSRQRDTVGTGWPTASHGLAVGTRQRWQNEIQSLAPGRTQEACAGRGLRGRSEFTPGLAGANSANQVLGPWQLPAHAAGQVRLSKRLPDAQQSCVRLCHG